MRLLPAVVLTVALAGCPSEPIRPPADVILPDGGMRDAAPVDAFRFDGGDFDADLDAPPFDAPGLDAPGLDAPSSDFDADLDAAPSDDQYLPWFFDAPFIDVPPYDAGEPDVTIFSPDGGSCAADPCSCMVLGADCSTTSCPSGETCLSDVCGRHCVVAGAPCSAAGDCAAGSSCLAGHCSRTGGGCGDSRDCPAGHACLGGTCSDRRVSCSGPGDPGCPYGFACGPSFCERIVRRCASSLACQGLPCVDVDGDGLRECQFTGACQTNADCSGDLVCEPRPEEFFASCGRYGACTSAADCPSGMECRDLWGDGIRECVEPGGCSSTAACSGLGICGTPATGGPPTCIE